MLHYKMYFKTYNIQRKTMNISIFIYELTQISPHLLRLMFYTLV